MKKIDWKNHLATIGGLLTSLGLAWQVIDYNTFTIEKDWLKLVILSLPAVGGFFSTFKTTK